MKKTLVLISILFIAIPAIAQEEAGKLVTYEGNVKVYNIDNVRGTKVSDSYMSLFVQDLIKTKRNSSASLRLADESKIVLTERSSMEIHKMKNISVNEGKVLFSIKKQGNMKGVMIKTKTATIGVKGTTFAVVSDNESVDVFLHEGKLHVMALEGQFKHFIKKEMDFDSYMKEQQDAFQEYKDTMEKEFVEFVKDIMMEGGSAISITGNEVRDVKIPNEIEQELLQLEQF